MKRIGVVAVSFPILEQALHLEPGTRVVEVYAGQTFGTFDVIVEGAAVPETNADEPPRLVATITVTAPKVEFVPA